MLEPTIFHVVNNHGSATIVPTSTAWSIEVGVTGLRFLLLWSFECTVIPCQ